MLNNMKLGTKIAGTIVLILVIIGASIALTFVNLNGVGNGTNELAKHNMKAIEVATAVELGVQNIRYQMGIYGVTGEAAKYNIAAAQFKESMAYLDTERNLAQNDPYLKLVLPDINKSDELLTQYSDLSVQTKAAYDDILKTKTALIAIGGTMVGDLDKYIKNQNAAVNQAYVGGADAAKYNDQMSKLQGINTVNSNVLMIRLYTAKALEARDPAQFDIALKYFAANEDILKGLIAKGGNTDALNKLLSNSETYRQGTLSMQQGYVKLAELSKQRVVVSDNLVKVVSGIALASVKDATGTTTSTNNTVQTTIYTLMFSFLAAVLIGGAVGFFVIRRISSSIKEITEVSKQISQGDVDVNIQVHSKDEIGELAESFAIMIENTKMQAGYAERIAKGDLDFEIVPRSEGDKLAISMKTVVETLRALIEEMKHMAREQDAGDIEVMVDESKFSGAYKEMAIETNQMVGSHIEAILKMLKCIDAFGKGDFDAPLEPFPGKKVVANESVEGVRKNLKDVSKEINTLVAGALEGKLDTKADASLFEGDWKNMIKGMNDLLEAVVEPIKEASDVLKQMSEGNLNAKVEGHYKGDHAVIKESLNSTIVSVKGYINEIARVLSRMAQGDLNVEITAEFKGDFAELKKSINNIVSALNEVLGEINVAAEQVSGGSKQVAMSSQALSQGATEQASAVEEITSTVHEIAEQTKINAGNANKAKELSTGSSKDAVVGNEQMKEMVKAMKEINESSANISKIISVIDEIAFQTNILALNAAVEAARAGQYGKGFAVVAEEVRNLAARSANAAKETTVLIENSITKVNHGTEIATDTANALDKIVGSVSSTAEIVENIAKSSQEQATAISQVNEGIYQISQVTQSNTATAEESAAASEEMTSQAQLLKEMVDRFKLKHQSRGFHNQGNYGGGSFHGKPRMVVASADEMDYDGEISISLDDKEFGKY